MSGRAEVIDRRALLVGTLACGAGGICGVVGARNAAAMATPPSGLSSLPIPASRNVAFRLIRQGSALGTHTLDFSVEGGPELRTAVATVAARFGAALG